MRKVERAFKDVLSKPHELRVFASLLGLLTPPIRISTYLWAKTYRFMSQEESSRVGKFDPDITPYMEYAYDCADNPQIPIVTGIKSAQIGWTEFMNNVIGKVIHTSPRKMMIAFPQLASAKVFSKEKLQVFFSNTEVLRELVNQGVSTTKVSFNFFTFKGGWLKLITTRSISAMKSSSIPFIVIEEPDDVKDEVDGQGDSLDNMKERQKTFALCERKVFYGGTPTNMDFSRVETAYKQSNQLVFKPQCHECEELHELSFANLIYSNYPSRRIDEVYGENDPETATYHCPHCGVEWSFKQKNLNVVAGKRFGFVDFTGNFSKGWHSNRPNVIDNFGFSFNELMSPFEESNFVNLAKAKILAELELKKGKESAMKSFTNNKMGKPYASGHSAIEPAEMRMFRINYPEGIVPMEGLFLTMGVDVQHNRFAIVIRAWGRRGCSYLVKWTELYGDIFNYDDNVWEELKGMILGKVPHASGNPLYISACAIDAGDGATVELVYRFIREMSEFHSHVFATKGVQEFTNSSQDIYSEPPMVEVTALKQARRSLAERMGVTLFTIGAHRAHDEVLRRVALHKIPDVVHDKFYFCETEYGGYEEQMTSCRKLIGVTRSGQDAYKLIAGKRKEAMDCEKLNLWCMIAVGIREYTDMQWSAIEKYINQRGAL